MNKDPTLLMVWNNNGVWTFRVQWNSRFIDGNRSWKRQGPDGGEFFGDDYWIAKPTYHAEIAIEVFMLCLEPIV